MPYAYEMKNHWNIVLYDYDKVCIPGTIRTHDVGRKGHNQRMTCKSKGSKKWITFSWHIAKSDVKVIKHGDYHTLQAVEPSTEKILRNVRQKYGAIKIVRP